ncbi:MAG: molecular chaperone TorD family protein [Actinomycetaceae bacterium]|nr:molecular chaperone TorD family protein [Actinomycetaceae bacterium]
MIEKLDAFAGAFAALAAFHLRPAPDGVVAQVVSTLSEWPVPENAEIVRGKQLILASAEGGEDEYTRWRDQDLLYGITASAKVPPYESVHRGEDHLIFDTQTVQVRRAFFEMGYEAPKIGHEPDDHIGLELDFLSKCCLRAADLLEDGEGEKAEEVLAATVNFTTDHFLQWVPGMLEAAAQNAQTQWVQGIMWLSAGSCAAWEEFLLDSGYLAEKVTVVPNNSEDGRVFIGEPVRLGKKAKWLADL